MMFFSYTENISQLAFLDKFVRDHLRRLKFPEERSAEIRRFVKSYHEIRNRIEETEYIPNFDVFDMSQKRKVISTMTRYSEDDVLGWTDEDVQRRFDEIVAHEAKDLERDVGSIS